VCVCVCVCERACVLCVCVFTVDSAASMSTAISDVASRQMYVGKIHSIHWLENVNSGRSFVTTGPDGHVVFAYSCFVITVSRALYVSPVISEC